MTKIDIIFDQEGWLTIPESKFNFRAIWAFFFCFYGKLKNLNLWSLYAAQKLKCGIRKPSVQRQLLCMLIRAKHISRLEILNLAVNQGNSVSQSTVNQNCKICLIASKIPLRWLCKCLLNCTWIIVISRWFFLLIVSVSFSRKKWWILSRTS